MLAATNVTKTFGGLVAVSDIEFTVEAEEIVGLIGPNGAGKTTVFNVITGVHSPDTGSILFNERELVGRSPDRVARLGIARTFQGARTFNDSSVLDNVVMGAVFGNEASVSLEEAREYARDTLAFVGLDGREAEKAGQLTIANRKQLELAKGLAARPDLILVDEIGAGLTPTEMTEITSSLTRARDEYGVSILWIEHVMEAIMSATDRIIVLDQGSKIADGTPDEIRSDPAVSKAYFGEVTP